MQKLNYIVGKYIDGYSYVNYNMTIPTEIVKMNFIERRDGSLPWEIRS